MSQELLNRKELAEYFSVKPGTVKRWQQLKKITPYCRVNGRPRYRIKDLNDLVRVTTKTETNGK